MTNRVVYDGGKSAYEEYKAKQLRIASAFQEPLNVNSIVIFEDTYYVYEWDLQEHRTMFREMSPKDIRQAMKDGRIT